MVGYRGTRPSEGRHIMVSLLGAEGLKLLTISRGERGLYQKMQMGGLWLGAEEM